MQYRIRIERVSNFGAKLWDLLPGEIKILPSQFSKIKLEHEFLKNVHASCPTCKMSVIF